MYRFDSANTATESFSVRDALILINDWTPAQANYCAFPLLHSGMSRRLVQIAASSSARKRWMRPAGQWPEISDQNTGQGPQVIGQLDRAALFPTVIVASARNTLHHAKS